MNLCEANRAVSLEVKNFMLHVPNVKEESITDFLTWKWKELDARFNYLKVSTFTRQEESTTTGADFEMELWFVGSTFHWPLVFQAKKFCKPHDSYLNKLNYPANTQGQLATLLGYANANSKLPFYAFYSTSDAETQPMCTASELSDTTIFMADAYTVKAFADGSHGKRISKNRILEKSNPFHCMFCCPLARSGEYFRHYFSSLPGGAAPRSNERMPNYVRLLLDGQILEVGEREISEMIHQNELGVFRFLAVYDARELPGETSR
jgi:hypothetical protein